MSAMGRKLTLRSEIRQNLSSHLRVGYLRRLSRRSRLSESALPRRQPPCRGGDTEDDYCGSVSRHAENEDAQNPDWQDDRNVRAAHSAWPGKASIYPVSHERVGVHSRSLSLPRKVRNGSEADTGEDLGQVPLVAGSWGERCS